MKQVGNTILAKGGNHILAKRDNSAWPKGSKLSGFSKLTDKQLAELLTKGKTGTIRGFVKNGGGTFDAALTLDDQFKTSFVFEPRDTPRQGKRNKRK